MARPIKETPVLKGEDAFNFEWQRLMVENRTPGRIAAYFCLLNDRISRIYEKNGFKPLTKKEEDDHTRLMFFDMMDVE